MRKTLFTLVACAAFLCACASNGKATIKESGEATNSAQNASHEHTYSSSWSYDDSDHWHASTCGHDAVKDKASHTFVKWEVDTQPTETSEGSRHRYCSVCHYKQSETMPKVEHVHTWGETTYSWGLDYATCTAKHSCTINLYHVEEETVNTSYEVIDEATTDDTGRGCYKAVFENENFQTQYKYVTIPKLYVPVSGISLGKSSAEVSKGDYTYVYASVLPTNASNKNVIWSSSNEEVATVTNGKVVGVNEGTATITATTEEGGYSATCEVTVTYIPVTGVSFTKESMLLEIGEESSTLYPHVEPSNATITDVTWSIEDESIASYETTWLSGVTVKGLSVGETTITATTKEGGFTASCKIIVMEKKNLSYEVGEASIRIYQYNSANYVSAYVPLTNKGNIDICVSSTGFDIEDSEENLKQSVDSYCVECHPSIIRPGETTYVYIDEKYTADTTAGLVCLPHLSVKDASEADCIRYDVGEEINFVSDAPNAGFKANVQVTNNTEKASSAINVAVFVFDKNGDYYTTLRAYNYTALEPGSSKELSASNWDLTRHGNELTIDDIGSYKAIAYEYEFFF